MRMLPQPNLGRDPLAALIASAVREKDGYAIGGCDANSTRTSSGPPTYGGMCYRGCKSLCDLTRVGSSVHNVAATTQFTVQVVPTISQYFDPVAALMVVTENGNPNANRRARITAVVIAGSPQEPIDDRAPTAVTTQYYLTDTYAPTDYGPWPVQWGIFSVAALTKPLQIIGFNQNAVAIDVNVVVFGNARNELPPGCTPGVPHDQSGGNGNGRTRRID